MTFNRIIEMMIKPPFKYFVMPSGCFHINKSDCFNSLNKAKEMSEKLFLYKGVRSSIYNVYYKEGDWEQRAGWMSNKILTLNQDCVWYKPNDSFTIHTSFLKNYDVRDWNPNLYDKIRKSFIDNILKDEDDWETVKSKLSKIEIDNFKIQVKKACNKVERKLNDFISANDELTELVRKKYPNVRAKYAIFDRMIMFYLEDKVNGDKEFYSLDELEKYLKKR